MTPRELLETMLRSDAARPRLTYYDDAGPERLELSAKVLANWVNKAANALQEHLDAQVGTRVHLDLPSHWRTVYWALAAWSVGAEVTMAAGRPGGATDGTGSTDGFDASDLAPDAILVTDRPGVAAAFAGESALVTLAMLARANPDTPPGAMDEARELATFGDRFAAWATPAPTDAALRIIGEAGPTEFDYASVVPQRDWPAGSRALVEGPPAATLLDVLGAWAVDGSVVLTAPGTDLGPARSGAEAVTLVAGPAAG